MDIYDRGRTKAGLCKHTMLILHGVYKANLAECLADVMLSLDAFRSNTSATNFVSIKRHFDDMIVAYERFRVFEVHGEINNE